MKLSISTILLSITTITSFELVGGIEETLGMAEPILDGVLEGTAEIDEKLGTGVKDFNLDDTFLRELNSYGLVGSSIKTVKMPRYKEYDFVVVGSGPGGSSVANRLSENPDWTILLLEAGEPENIFVQIPLTTALLQQTAYNYGYRSEPQTTACLGMKDRRCTFPRGKSLGGTSTINYMIHTRGNKLDYDEWAKNGNTGWSYNDILPYYIKSEKFRVKGNYNSSYHGKHGYVTVEHLRYHTKLATAFVEAGRDAGYKVLDYNGPEQIGFSHLQVAEDRGTRCSASKAYLRVDRPNLDIVTGAQVTQVLIDANKKAHGVEYMKGKGSHKVYVKKEVILSAGVLDSAKLLMLSGIGPKDHLKAMGIEVIKDAKVGYNLYEHLGFQGLIFKVNATVAIVVPRILANPQSYLDYGLYRKGPIVGMGAEAIAFLRTKYAKDERPDLELCFLGGTFAADNGLSYYKGYGVDDDVYRQYYAPLENKDAWSVWPIVQKPRSVGRIKLKSKNPQDAAIIEANFFTDPADVEVILEGIKKVIELSKSDSFQAYGSEIYKVKVPGCTKYEFGSDDYWRCAIRHLPSTMDHEIGTAKMGPESDPDAVVSPELKVHGIEGLRVVDASIMPIIPIGHVTAGIYMIGEKAADMIKASYEDSRSINFNEPFQ